MREAGDDDEDELGDADTAEDSAPQTSAPRIKLVDGEIVIDQDSLVIQAQTLAPSTALAA
jgi:hypothetical protein